MYMYVLIVITFGKINYNIIKLYNSYKNKFSFIDNIFYFKVKKYYIKLKIKNNKYIIYI